MTWPGQALDIDMERLLKTDRWMRQLARNLVHDDAAADDIRQEAWMAWLKNAPSSLKDSRSWLARVVSNFVKKHHRTACRRKRRERLASRPACAGNGLPEASLKRIELREQVLHAVRGLQEPYRSVIVLRFMEGMRLKEVAKARGIPVNTVKSRLSRGLQLLRARLDGLYGRREGWSMLLLPLLPCLSGLKTGTAAKTAMTLTLKQKGMVFMSMKYFVSAACASIAVIIGVGVVIVHMQESPDSRPPITEPVLADTSLAGGAASPDGGSSAEGMRRGAVSKAGVAFPLDVGPDGEGDGAQATGSGGGRPAETNPEQKPPPGAVQASEETLAARRAYSALRKQFGEGGRTGWTNVAKNIGPLQKSLLHSEDGFEAFLASLDREEDASFLEALMHHLPMAGTEFRKDIMSDQALKEEIWGRFEEAEDPDRRLAFLRFFAFNRRLNGARMDDFMAIAKEDPSGKVRQLSVDAIASNRELLEDTWPVLAHVVENDPSAECRETGIYGLGFVDTEKARALVHEAFLSPDENMRAAVLRSKAGEKPPVAVAGEDILSYLVDEFQAATTYAYKKALGERIFERSPQALKEEIQKAMPTERDFMVKKAYREALAKIADARKAGG